MPNRFIDEFRWPPGIEEKVLVKHGLLRHEVEECFFNQEQERRRSRDRRVLLGRSDAGRYVMVVYIMEHRVATIISARDMTESERRRYRRK